MIINPSDTLFTGVTGTTGANGLNGATGPTGPTGDSIFASYNYFLYDDFRHGLYTNTGYIISSNPYAYLVGNTTATTSTTSSGLNCTISQTSGSTNSIQMFRYDTLATSGAVNWMMNATGIDNGTVAHFFYGMSETNNISALVDNMIGFYFTSGISYWACITRKAGTETRTTTTVAMDNTTSRTLKIVINSAFSSVTFYIDGTLVATHTTNIPTVALRSLSILASKSYNASYTYHIRWLKVTQET